jgi:transcriptional regulator with XRE-family HTH domain
MAISDFKEMVENARKLKGYSQRALAKKIGLSQSTYNDTINGKIKKPDIDILKKIAEELDLSLDLMLKESGYGESFYLYGLDKYQNKSTKDLKNLIDEYKKSELDLLEFDHQKRDTTTKVRKKMFSTIENMKTMKEDKDSLYTIDKAIDDVQSAFDQLKMVEEKYDYDKLPKDV